MSGARPRSVKAMSCWWGRLLFSALSVHPLHCIQEQRNEYVINDSYSSSSSYDDADYNIDNNNYYYYYHTANGERRQQNISQKRSSTKPRP